MADLFSAYAQEAQPAPVRRKQERAEKAPSALDLKMAEKQRLNKAYRAGQRERTKAVLASEPRLSKFLRYLRTVGPTQSDELVEAIAESWLPASSQDVRLFALRMIDARCNKLNRQAGFEDLDDPLPPATSTYFRVRAALYSGGRL